MSEEKNFYEETLEERMVDGSGAVAAIGEVKEDTKDTIEETIPLEAPEKRFMGGVAGGNPVFKKIRQVLGRNN